MERAWNGSRGLMGYYPDVFLKELSKTMNTLRITSVPDEFQIGKLTEYK
jgi:hypothetical protein